MLIFQLPIYPNPENDAPITLIDSPHPLSPYIARARESVAGALSGAGGHIGSGVSRWITFERRVEGEWLVALLSRLPSTC